MEPPVINPMERLTSLIYLEERCRSAKTHKQLSFIITNETIGLAPYRQAILWNSLTGVVALSGVPVVNTHIPMVQWANAVCQQFVKKNLEAGVVSLDRLQEREQNQWSEWLPPYALWLPLPGKNQELQTVLLLARETPWNEGEILLLQRLAGAYGHAWMALYDHGIWHYGRRYLSRLSTLKIIILLGLIAALMFMPVRLSVLAPGELVPVDPFLVRSPLEGVIEKIHVRPNDLVQEGQLLFDLDPTTLQSKLEVAAKTLTTVEAEYRQAVQQAVWDAKSKAQLNIISSRIDERQTELNYLTELLARIRVKAPRSGVVVFDDPSSWLGKPVAMGEKIMIVTGIHDTEIEAWVAIGDNIELPKQARTTFFPNVDPLYPVVGQVRYMAYEALPRPNGTLAFRLRATMDQIDKPRLGLKGTVRVDGEEVTLAYWLFRKPLALLRQTIGQ